MTNPPRTLLEQFGFFRLCLCQAVAARTFLGGLLLPLIALIIGRIRGIGQRFARPAARIAAGTCVPRRRPAGPRKTAAHVPRPPSSLPRKFAWLLPLVPGVAAFGTQLEILFRDPEMAALLAAAPEPMGRMLRPLCWMLGVTPPAILAWRPSPAPRPAADKQPDPPPADPAAPPAAPPRRRPPAAKAPPRRAAPSKAGPARPRGPPLRNPA